MHMNKHMKPPASGGSVSIDIDGSKRNPWLKFFPTDWDSDLALKRCSMAARGLWIGMIGIMHQSTDRPGSFIVKSIVPTDDEAARLLGCSTREFRKLRAELENSGVFSRDPDGVIFSRRMRRDIEKAKKDKENGGRGGNPAVKRGVNPKDNREDKAQRPDTRDQRSDAPSLREGVTPATTRKLTELSEQSEPSFDDLAEAERFHLRGNEVWAEWERFRDYNLAHGTQATDWSAKWRVWLSRMGDF
jgi:hypothetical protein